MAEAVIHAVSVNPCAHCAGQRKVEEREWRSPMFLVHCLGCGNVADGESVAEAVALWNEENAPREVDAAEQTAMAVAMVAPKLTREFLDTLYEVAAVSGAASAQDLVTWCESNAS